MKKVYLNSNWLKVAAVCAVGSVMLAGKCDGTPNEEDPNKGGDSTVLKKGVEYTYTKADGKKVTLKIVDDADADSKLGGGGGGTSVFAKDATIKYKDNADAEQSVSVADIIKYIQEGDTVTAWETGKTDVKWKYTDLKAEYDKVVALAKGFKTDIADILAGLDKVLFVPFTKSACSSASAADLATFKTNLRTGVIEKKLDSTAALVFGIFTGTAGKLESTNADMSSHGGTSAYSPVNMFKDLFVATESANTKALTVK